MDCWWKACGGLGYHANCWVVRDLLDVRGVRCTKAIEAEGVLSALGGCHICHRRGELKNNQSARDQEACM